MKKVLIILVCLLLFSCKTRDPNRYIDCVKSAFPQSTIYGFYGLNANREFIVIDSTGVKYVVTDGDYKAFIYEVTALEKIQ